MSRKRRVSTPSSLYFTTRQGIHFKQRNSTFVILPAFRIPHFTYRTNPVYVGFKTLIVFLDR